jgi:hypothetical protein
LARAERQALVEALLLHQVVVLQMDQIHLSLGKLLLLVVGVVLMVEIAVDLTMLHQEVLEVEQVVLVQGSRQDLALELQVKVMQVVLVPLAVVVVVALQRLDKLVMALKVVTVVTEVMYILLGRLLLVLVPIADIMLAVVADQCLVLTTLLLVV